MSDLKRAVELIKESIHKHSNPKAYAEEIGIKVGTMYDFLNQKKGINVKTFFKIITPLGLKVEGNEKLFEVFTVWIDGCKYQKYDNYEGKEIIMCFGDASSSKQFVLLRDKGKNELVIY